MGAAQIIVILGMIFSILFAGGKPVRAATYSIWPDPITPTFPAYNNPNPIEMGLKFRSSVAGYVTGVRYFKASGSTVTQTIGRLWTIGGTKLAEVTFTNETASGWQTAVFPAPVAIQANTTYIISYYLANGNHRFSLSQNFFTTTGVTNGPLTALAEGVDGHNGVYSDTGGFFGQANLSTNYWVDLIFDDTPPPADTTPPTITSVIPANLSTGIIRTSILTINFSEAMDSTTIIASNFEIRDPYTNLVTASLTYNPATWSAVLDPSTDLLANTTYTVYVLTTVKDLAGNSLASEYTWSFTTESGDSTRPTVSSVVPVNGATGVSRTANQSVTFSEAMNSGTINATNIQLRDPANTVIPAVVTYDEGTFTAVLNPVDDLVSQTVFSGHVLTGVTDVAGNALASEFTWSFTTEGADVTAPTVISVKPINASTKLHLATNATIYFSEAMNESTLNASSIQLHDSSNNLIDAEVTYDGATQSAIINPTADLSYGTAYIVRVVGGDLGIADTSNNHLAADYTWTFSTVAQRPPVDQAPGGPILIVTSTSNLFTRYYTEILRTEGMNEFATSDLSAVNATTLSAYDIVILGEMTLTSDQVTMFTTWVENGGHLIAMRPDKQLAGLLGLTDAGSTLTDRYMLVDTAQQPGTGIYGQTMQFHGTADSYTLNGATSLATLYSTISASTPNPAATIRSFGTNGGLAVAFTFDLARSIVYTHQGNPVWQIGHVNPLQNYGTALDLFYDAANPWIDSNRIGVPQADEQQRFFVNLIQYMNSDEKPLPRFWYFPSGKKAVIILTGDDHVGRGSPSGDSMDFFDRHLSQSPTGCSVLDWECVRSSSYGYVGNTITDAQAAAYTAQGFEFGVHADAGLASGGGWCGTWPSDMAAQYAFQYNALFEKYASLPVQSSERNHCYSYFGYTGPTGWLGYAGNAEVEANLGIRLDTNISYNPASFASVNPGYNRGTGMPMRFAQVDTAGVMTSFLDIYNGGTQITDDNGQGAAAIRTIVDSYLEAANGTLGYYGAFVVNMHSDNWYGWSYDGSDQVVASAQAHEIPVVSGSQMVEWLDGRNSSSFNSIAWDNDTHTLSFTVNVGTGAQNIQAMLPVMSGIVPLNTISLNGQPVSYTTQVIKGVTYAFFPAATGNYTVTYQPDLTAPIISAVATNLTSGVAATITWTTDEPSTSVVDYGTTTSLGLSVSNSTLVSQHAIDLTGLTPNTLYYYRVSSADASNNTASSPDEPATFTTPSAGIIDTTVTDFSSGTPGTNLVISQMANGEVILKPVLNEDFSGSTLPTGWSIRRGSGSATVSGGILTIDGADFGTTATYGPGTSVEAMATFGGATFQHVGFGSSYQGTTGDTWAMISTGSSGGSLFARTWNGVGAWTTETSTPIPNSAAMLGTPHRFQVDWKSESIDYYVDGVLVATHNIAISNPMHVMPSDSTIGDATVTLNWLHVTPYASSGTFLSRVFDLTGTVTSGTIAWDAEVPSNTILELNIRTGNTPTPGEGWTDFASVTNGAAIGSGFRYIQYQAVLGTTVSISTPILQEVRFLYNRGVDSTPPTILNRSPIPDATNVGLADDICVTFDEPMNSASFTSSSFRMRATGNSTDVTANIIVNGATAILQPEGNLLVNTVYTVTVSGNVSDLSSNLLGNDSTWSFTTTSSGIYTDTTLADFSAGTPGSETYIAQTGNGELVLMPTVKTEFSGLALPVGWTGNTFTSGGTFIVANEMLSLDGARAGTIAVYSPGHSMEGVVIFSAARYQHFGFGVTYGTSAGEAWAIISTGVNGTGLLARSWNGTGDYTSETSTVIPGSYFGTPHRYRVDWSSTDIKYYVDNVLVATHTIAITTQMRPMPADSDVGGPALVVDWLRMSPYAASGTFTSRVFDANASVYWTNLTATISRPVGTTAVISTRTSNDRVNWSEWTSVTGLAPLINQQGRYFQYQVNMTTSDLAVSPQISDVSVFFGITPTAVELNYFRAARTPGGVQLTWETVNEATLAGFNLYRREPGGEFVLVNAELIAPQMGGQPLGSVYTFLDEGIPLDRRYEYRLEGIETNLQVGSFADTTFWPYSTLLPAVLR